MTKEFQYLKEELTSDLIELLVKDYNLDIKDAIKTLYESETYTKLNDSNTGLYMQGSLYVYSYLQTELNLGKLN